MRIIIFYYKIKINRYVLIYIWCIIIKCWEREIYINIIKYEWVVLINNYIVLLGWEIKI